MDRALFVELNDSLKKLTKTISSILDDYVEEDKLIAEINGIISEINSFTYGQNFVDYLSDIM